MTAAALRLATARAADLPEAAQEEIGREVLARIDALARLRAELEIGVSELDAGLGREIDIEAVIGQARAQHASNEAGRLAPLPWAEPPTEADCWRSADRMLH